jgi:hypothetical protein
MIPKEFQEIRDRLHALREKTGEHASPDCMLGLLAGLEQRERERESARAQNPVVPTPPMQQTTSTHLTTDRNDPRLGHGTDDGPVPQNEVYLVLSAEEIAKGFVRPLRTAYKHTFCGVVTSMGEVLCKTYARNPKFYSHTYCIGCKRHLPVAEFNWVEDGKEVGS